MSTVTEMMKLFDDIYLTGKWVADPDPAQLGGVVPVAPAPVVAQANAMGKKLSDLLTSTVPANAPDVGPMQDRLNELLGGMTGGTAKTKAVWDAAKAASDAKEHALIVNKNRVGATKSLIGQFFGESGDDKVKAMQAEADAASAKNNADFQQGIIPPPVSVDGGIFNGTPYTGSWGFL